VEFVVACMGARPVLRIGGSEQLWYMRGHECAGICGLSISGHTTKGGVAILRQGGTLRLGVMCGCTLDKRDGSLLEV
jgi:hypothetical protein